MSELEEVIKELPCDLHQEVVDFARFLMEKRGSKRKGRMKLEWRGALEDMKEKYTSVELQHKILEWRGGLMYLLDTGIFYWNCYLELLNRSYRGGRSRSDISSQIAKDFSNLLNNALGRPCHAASAYLKVFQHIAIR